MASDYSSSAHSTTSVSPTPSLPPSPTIECPEDIPYLIFGTGWNYHQIEIHDESCVSQAHYHSADCDNDHSVAIWKGKSPFRSVLSLQADGPRPRRHIKIDGARTQGTILQSH
ncbi:hypothetical protein ElyMa_002388200 [Elysia marginata]|uniref:Farnesoic acid O-methyl transferase domain-containing protein n=1 Tax=Elysia marginata TaxID=1093978 RepID=A0AAV4GCX3_9GAST|nr:hypothetical protein ElyMa_002388200 [Elysia marginata]